MVRLFLGWVTCGVILMAIGCASDRVNPPGDATILPPVSIAIMLPGLPNTPAERSAMEAGSHVFVEADEVENQGAYWFGDVLNLDSIGFRFSIVRFNLGTSIPAGISLDGTLNGLWLAVSDYETGGWHFLGEASAPQAYDLTGGNYKSPNGLVYFALVCPDGASADTTTTLNYETVPQTDFDPPEWQEGGVGIKSLDTSYYEVTLEWYPAIDVESPPVRYLIYYGENAAGIDWDNPRLTVSAGFTSTIFYVDENPVLRDYAVCARDAAGNITSNTNFMSGSIPETMSYPIFDWVPGDKVVMSWDDPLLDSYVGFTGPHFLMGSNEDAADLAGFVEFSGLSGDSGVEEVWATLLEPAPLGGFLLEGHMGKWGLYDCVTYSFNLVDTTGALKSHIGNYTIKPNVVVGGDICYLRNGPLTWPQDETWQTGDRLEIAWDNPAYNLDLRVEAPNYEHASPTHPDDLIGMVDFSQSSEDSGEAVEWAQLAAGGDTGNYLFTIQLMDDGGPSNVDLSWILYDSEGGVRLGPGTASVRNDWGEIFHFFWLEKESVE